MRIASQQGQPQKRAGDKIPGLKPPVPFYPLEQQAGSVTFKALIDKGKDHNNKTNQVDKVVGPVLESLGNTGENYVAMRIALLNDIFIPNGVTAADQVRERSSSILTLCTATAKNEWNTIARQAKTPFLEDNK